jgi:hypothetical protein
LPPRRSALVSALRSIGYHPRVISNDAQYCQGPAIPPIALATDSYRPAVN